MRAARSRNPGTVALLHTVLASSRIPVVSGLRRAAATRRADAVRARWFCEACSRRSLGGMACWKRAYSAAVGCSSSPGQGHSCRLPASLRSWLVASPARLRTFHSVESAEAVALAIAAALSRSFDGSRCRARRARARAGAARVRSLERSNWLSSSALARRILFSMFLRCAVASTRSRWSRRSRGAVERHGGSVAQFIGDAVMAVFGVPVVHEDDALRACRAAVEMREAFAGLGLEGRIGVSTGEVVTGTVERLATGDAVNVAARLEQAAQPGEVVIAEATRLLVGAAVDVEPLEPLLLKGKREPMLAFRLLAARAAPARRHDTVFVGREPELSVGARGVATGSGGAALRAGHDRGRCGSWQVPARGRGARLVRGARRPRPLPPVWGRDHLLAGGGDGEAARRVAV